MFSVHSIALNSVAFLLLRNLWRWSSTTRSRYCFCSSCWVRMELKFWMRGTPRSAASFTTFNDLAISFPCWYCTMSAQWTGSISKKSEWICSKVKNILILAVTKWSRDSWSLTSSGLIVILLGHGWDPFFCNAFNIMRLVSIKTLSLKKAKVTSSSLKYHWWLRNFSRTAVATSRLYICTFECLSVAEDQSLGLVFQGKPETKVSGKLEQQIGWNPEVPLIGWQF